MVSLLRKRRPMELASGSSPSFPLADLAVPRKLLQQRSSWLLKRAVTCSAPTWLSTAGLRLCDGGLNGPPDRWSNGALAQQLCSRHCSNRYLAEKLDGKSSDWTEPR